jgi:autotransporter-associated beta strand protein
MKRSTCIWAWFVILATVRAASAVDVFWNMAGPADWNTPGNWNPGRVPTGTDNATFNNGGTANITSNTPSFADIRFGDGANSGGTVNQTAGTLNATEWLRMDLSGNANSNYFLSGGSASFVRVDVNEVSGTGSSDVTVQGGTLTVPQSGGGGGQGAVFIGSSVATSFLNVGPSGMLVVGGDTAGNQSIVVGYGGSASGNAQFAVFGGTVSVGAGNVEVGGATPGFVTQSGGTVNLFTNPGNTSWLHVGDQSNGTYTLSGGSLTFTNAKNDLVLGNLGSGTFNLSGGTATVGAIFGFGSSRVFNFDGGTLRPNADQSAMDQTAFMASLTTANVRNGGAIIDTNGHNVTIAQPLVHSTIGGDNAIDGGLTKMGAGTLTITLAGAPTYTGQTSVFGGSLLYSFGAAFGFATNGANYTVSGPGSTFGGIGGTGVFIENGSTMTVSSGATLAPSGPLDIAAHAFSNGSTLVVDGAGSSATTPAGADFTLGLSGGSFGVLTVSNNATFTVGAGATSNIVNGTININGGSIDLKTLNYTGGQNVAVNFNSGSLSFLGDLHVGVGGFLGRNVTLDASKILTLSGTTTIDQFNTLTLSGGTLSTGNLVVSNGGAFDFIAGTLTITGAGASVNYPIVTNATTRININADNVSLGDGSLTGFNHGGVLNVNGPYTLTFNSASYARLGVLTILSGGTINASNGVTLPAGSNLVGSGNVNTRVTGEAGALIQANGSLSLGDATSPAGYDFGGELRTGVGTVTLNSSGTAGLGNLTTLGSGVLSGTLNAANGYFLDFDQAITGFGPINSTNNILQRAIINGSVQGKSMAQPITLSGWIKGTGTFTNVVFTGTHDPGFSPTLLHVGTVAYAPSATLLMELGGTSRGSQYDAIDSSGTMNLGGTLDLVQLNGFVPMAGDKFVLMNYPTETGTFSSVTGTSPAPGLTYNAVYLPTSLVILTTTNGEKTWGVDASGNSSLGANWIGGVAPGGVGDSAAFSTIITAPRTVTLDADTTVGSLKFDSPISYTIAGPHTLTLQAAGASAAALNVLNTHGNGAHTISAPIMLASDLNVIQNSTGTLRITGSLNDSAAHAITKTGAGVTEIGGLPTFGANTNLNVTGGTLRFALASGAATVGAGVQATVNGSATLELAGAASALSSGVHRANILNNSSAASGLLVTGTNQQVGFIDGSGTTQVNAGSDLTANHIIQTALVIGGAMGNSATVNIAASDSSGNPLGQSSVVPARLAVALADGQAPAPDLGASSASSLLPPNGGAISGNPFAALELADSSRASNLAAVPEPSTILLLALGGLALLNRCRAWVQAQMPARRYSQIRLR